MEDIQRLVKHAWSTSICQNENACHALYLMIPSLSTLALAVCVNVRWAAQYGDRTPTATDPPPEDEAALLLEERSVHSTALLAVSLSNLDYVEQQVGGGGDFMNTLLEDGRQGAEGRNRKHDCMSIYLFIPTP